MFTKRTSLQNNFNLAHEKTSLQQHKVIDCIKGPVKLIAPPGARIKEILALRIAKILSQTEALAENILCFTGTDTTATALQMRLNELIGPDDASKINIYTVAAFCETVMQDNTSLTENKPLEIISTLESIRLFKKLIAGFPKNHLLKRYRSDVYHEINNLKKLFSFIKREHSTVESLNQKIDAFLAELPPNDQYGKSLQTGNSGEEKEMMEKLRAGLNEFDHYQNLLRINDRYDGDDLIYLVIKTLEENKKLLSGYQQKFQYIQVDDYNIISNTPEKLLKLIMSNNENPNILVIDYDEKYMVGLQSTASKDRLAFTNAFSNNWMTVTLASYFGRTQSFTGYPSKGGENFANQLAGTGQGALSENKPNKYIPGSAAGQVLLNMPVITLYNSVSAEMAAITNQVYELLQQNVDPAKIVIVYTQEQYIPALEQYVNFKNIPFYCKRNTNILQQPFIKKIIQLLRYISAEHEIPFSGDDLLFEILHFDFFKVPALEIAGLAVEVNNKKYSNPPAAIRKLLLQKSNAPAKDLFDTGIHTNLKSASNIFEKLISDASNTSIAQLFDNIIHEAMVPEYVDQTGDSIWLNQLLTTLSNFIKNETTRNPLLQLSELMDVIDVMEKEDLPLSICGLTGSAGGVRIITPGEAKEQEFEYVYIAGANASSVGKKDWFNCVFKLRNQVSSSLFNIDDEKDYPLLHHLFYATLSNPASHLSISFAKYNKHGKELAPTAFVTEILSRHSLPVNKIELTDDELSNYAILHKTKPRPQIERPGKAFVKPLLNKFVMNVSALNSYLNCPLGFYYKNIIRVPTGKNEAMEFGSAIHYTLETLFKKMSGGYLLPAVSFAQAKPNHFPLAAEMVDDFKWYMHSHRAHFTKEAFDRRMQYGDEVLHNYYDYYINKWNKVVSVERNIRGLTINGVPLKGKLDKLEFNGKEVNIVDYKTGDIEKALLKMRQPHDDDPNGGDYWRQAVFYSILVNNYNKKNWRVVSVEFDFIEQDKKKQYRKEKIIVHPADITTVLHQITEVWNKIQAGEFYTGCGKEDCHWCNFAKDNKLAIALHDKIEGATD